MLIMRPKKDPDAVVIQVVLWVCAVAFGVGAVIENVPWAFWGLSGSCIVASMVYALYRRGRVIVVSKDGIESVVFFVFRRFVPWERVASYRERKKQGRYMTYISWTAWLTHTGSDWIEDSFRLKVVVASGLPLYVNNNFTGYKLFKKLLKEKGVQRVKVKKK